MHISYRSCSGRDSITRLRPDTNAATPLLLPFALHAGARQTPWRPCSRPGRMLLWWLLLWFLWLWLALLLRVSLVVLNFFFRARWNVCQKQYSCKLYGYCLDQACLTDARTQRHVVLVRYASSKPHQLLIGLELGSTCCLLLLSVH